MDAFLMPRQVVEGPETLFASTAFHIALVLFSMSGFVFSATLAGHR